MEIKIGILAIQGAVTEHECALLKCLMQNGGLIDNIELKITRVTQAADVGGLDGLIIPGGESSVSSIIMDQAIMDELGVWVNNDRHVMFGICAGLITFSKNIENAVDGQQRRLSKVYYKLDYFYSF